MSKVTRLNNTQTLLNEYLEQEYNESQQLATIDDYFEFFSASQVLKQYDLSDEEIDAGICDAGNDGGCDSLFLFANGVLITDNMTFAEFKRGTVIEFFILQSKNTNSFSETPLQNWKTSCSNLLDMNKDLSQLKSRYNEKVRLSFELFRNLQISMVRKQPKININYKYITKGIEIHPNVQEQADELRVLVNAICPDATVSVDFIGADKLLALTKKVIDNVFTLTLSDTPIINQT
jgi:hypothetical protein